MTEDSSWRYLVVVNHSQAANREPEWFMSEISENQYCELFKAREVIVFGLDFERRLDILFENYKEVLGHAKSTEENFYNNERSRETLPTAMHKMNRLISNLLSAARMYLDQTDWALSMLRRILYDLNENANPCDRARRIFDGERCSQYDSCFEYRFIEKLRNQVQHRRPPVTGIQVLHRTRKTNGQDSTGVVATFNLDPQQLDSKDFSRKLKDEANRCVGPSGKIDLIPLINKYVECLFMVHRNTRESLSPLFQKSDRLLRTWLEEAEDSLRRSPADDNLAILRPWLFIFSTDILDYRCIPSLFKDESKLEIDLEWIDDRIMLQNKPRVSDPSR